MNMLEIQLYLWLLLAHFMGDFTFHPDRWIDEKRRRKWRSPYLYYHMVFHFSLSTIAIFWATDEVSIRGVLAGFIIAISHFVFDLSRIYYEKYVEAEWRSIGIQRGLIFLWEQIAHFCVLYLIALWIQQGSWMEELSGSMLSLLVLGLGYYIVLYPASDFVDLSTRDWQVLISRKDDEDVGLPQAGRTIGQLERLLALTFILLGQYTALGFLIGAKSVFRFTDLTLSVQHKKTEYILIGTLLSFSVVVVIGLILNYLLSYLGVW